MDKQERYDITYLRMALEWSNLSYCSRKRPFGLFFYKYLLLLSLTKSI